MGQQLYLTPVVRILLIINIGLFIITNVFSFLHPLLCVYFPTSNLFQPFQILTHMFMHHGLGHIFFNMFGLITFGPMIELVWKEQRFLFYYLFCGIGALLLQWGAYYWEISNGIMPIEVAEIIQLAGASGCLYGLLVAFAMLYPNNQVGLMFIPIYIKAKYAVPAFAILEIFLGFGRFEQGIAHFAHVGGALFGLILILFWRRKSML
ncbi:MAG: rhomboid family intramembrane serine protease [Saprospiraceae bacterium]|nr:rhomboid family intramembrane serine protease [Saprospiraceae bacterium]